MRPSGVHTVGRVDAGKTICARCGDDIPTDHSALGPGSNYVWVTDVRGGIKKWEAVPASQADIDALGYCVAT